MPAISRMKWPLRLALVAATAAAAAGPGLDDRQRSAQAATQGEACRDLNFYWEIGDAMGNARSGNGPGGFAATKIKPTHSGYIASAGKWLYGAYVLEKTGGTLDAVDDIPYLNFTSGYHDLKGCFGKTVGACGAETNNPRTAADAGQFYYDPGHLEAHAAKDARGLLGLKDLKAAELGPVIAAPLHIQGLRYSGPVLAGGAQLDAVGYAHFLQQILDGTLKMKRFLDANAVCASDDETLGGQLVHHCGVNGHNVALSSPPQLNAQLDAGNPDTSIGAPLWPADGEPWQYSMAHWIEKDGTYSSPGAFGFYPWIDKDRRWYGLLARYEFGNRIAYQKSVVCGRAIRNAWLYPPPTSTR